MDDVLDLTHPSHIDGEFTGVRFSRFSTIDGNDRYEIKAFFKYHATAGELRTQDVARLRDFLNGLEL